MGYHYTARNGRRVSVEGSKLVAVYFLFLLLFFSFFFFLFAPSRADVSNDNYVPALRNS